MIFAECGLNHNGSVSYAKNYIQFHKQNNFDVLSFQIREPEFYLKKKFKHLKLQNSFYKYLSNYYKKEKDKKICISLSSIKTFNSIKKYKFDYYKILSIAAKDYRLINSILKHTNSKIYISCGLLKKNDLQEVINKYKKNIRIKFIYTQLSYDKNDLNLLNLVDLNKKYPFKIAYGHHYLNLLPIFILQIFKNIDLFIYIKGEKKIKHADEKHALNFKKFTKLLLNLDEIKEIIGIKGKIVANNTIPDQNENE